MEDGLASDKRKQPRKAPQMPVGPNPALAKGLRVEPFGKVWAVVEGLGVISTHRERGEADAALAAIQQKRALPSPSSPQSAEPADPNRPSE